MEENDHSSEHHIQTYSPDEPEFWINLAGAIFMVLLAGMCSGLTVGYLSIDELALDIKIENGTEKEKKRVILEFLTKGHQN